MTRCPDCDALRLSLARTEGQLASADRSWIEMRDEADRAIDARDAAVQAYKDSAEVLAQVAAERDALVDDVKASAGELRINLNDMPPGSQMRRVVVANKLLRDERDRHWAGVVDRDRALDACAERIADLLGQHWPATLGRNLAIGGALCVSRLAAIGLVDGFWAWQPGRGRPHPGVHEVEV